MVPVADETQPETLALTAETASTAGLQDDLTQIRGITQELSANLRRLGIVSFKQIMELDNGTVGKLSKILSLGDQIDRDGWIQQATGLIQQQQALLQHQRRAA